MIEHKTKRVAKIDPQKQLFLDLYKDPASETFGNAYRTALKCGYSEAHSKKLTSRVDWIPANIIRDTNMITKSEQHLNDVVELTPDIDTKLGVDIAKMQMDASKYILDNLAKHKYNKKGDEQGDTKIQINITNYNKDKGPGTIDVEPEE